MMRHIREDLKMGERGVSEVIHTLSTYVPTLLDVQDERMVDIKAMWEDDYSISIEVKTDTYFHNTHNLFLETVSSKGVHVNAGCFVKSTADVWVTYNMESDLIIIMNTKEAQMVCNQFVQKIQDAKQQELKNPYQRLFEIKKVAFGTSEGYVVHTFWFLSHLQACFVYNRRNKKMMLSKTLYEQGVTNVSEALRTVATLQPLPQSVRNEFIIV